MKSKLWEKYRNGTMLKRIFIPMFILVVVESVLFFGVIFYNNILSQMEQNTRDIFDSKVTSRTQELENMMVNQWSNLKPDVEGIEAAIDDFLGENQIDGRGLSLKAEERHALLEQIADNLISTLRNHRVTGAYAFLCNEIPSEGTITLPGIYISDSNVENDNSITNADLMIRRGSKSLVEKMGIATESGWEPNITLKNENLKQFQQLYKNYDLLQEDVVDISDVGYWIPALQVGNDEVISYVLPIQHRGKVIGVLGIDISHDYLKKMLNYMELDADAKGGYSLVIKEGNSYRNIMTNNSFFSVDFKPGCQLDIKQGDQGEYLMQNDNKVILSTAKVNLYNNNTPYENQEWYLGAMMREQDLFAFTSKVKLILLYAIIGSLIMGLLLSILLSFWISKPVVALADRVRRMTFRDKLSIERTKIIEIDQLIDAIENTSNDAIDAVARFTKIIRLANTQLEGFELDYKHDKLFVTEDFFTAFGLNVDSDQLTAEEFRTLMSQFADRCSPSNSKSANEYIFNLNVRGRNIYLRLRYIDDKASHRYYGLVEEVSELMRERQLIEYERDHDVLTGLQNRRAYQRQMKRLFTIDATSIKVGALMMLDLDNLKSINDEFGHEYGDLYIQQAARAFRKLAPEGTVIARISGDEFNMFLHGYDSKAELQKVIDDFWQKMMKVSVEMPNLQKIHVMMSAGVAWYPDDSRDFTILQKYSDFAMYNIKHTLKGEIGNFCLDDYMSDVYMLRRKAEFNRILEENSITYHFQPIVSAIDGEVFAYEALMRPLSPTLKSPAEIIEIAKMESKLYIIEKITMTNSVELFHTLQKQGMIKKEVRLFINSIANQCLSDREIAAIERDHKDILDHIILELTENEELNEEYTLYKKRVLERWKAGLALDDYGSGYNSGRNLLLINPDFVKIDIDIIRDIDKDQDKKTIVRNTIDYCHERNKYVIAEGIETISELKTVVSMGVDYIQGYLTGRPSAVPGQADEEIKKEIIAYHRSQ